MDLTLAAAEGLEHMINGCEDMICLLKIMGSLVLSSQLYTIWSADGRGDGFPASSSSY
jgi:hypothetical protein